jgi:hypothetical protein
MDFYTIVTILAGLIVLAGFTVIVLFILALPGKIARRRGHPHADAVELMGWLGVLGGVSWISALIWSIHDSLTVDIRRTPKGEKERIRSILAEAGLDPAKADEIVGEKGPGGSES